MTINHFPGKMNWGRSLKEFKGNHGIECDWKLMGDCKVAGYVCKGCRAFEGKGGTKKISDKSD